MENIKSLPPIIRKGGVAAIYTSCGLGLILLPSSDYVIKISNEIVSSISNREVCLLISSKTPLTHYLPPLSDIASTLFELSDKPLTLQFENWNTVLGITDLFPQGLSVRMATTSDEVYILNGVSQPLLFIPITQKELSICKNINSGTFLFQMAIQDQQQAVEKPGIIKFLTNGSMKIIRE